MPPSGEDYPSATHVVEYLTRYEERYQLPVERPIEVTAVTSVADGLMVHTSSGEWKAGAVVSATGTWRVPVIPNYPGLDSYKGLQIHSARYSNPGAFQGMRVLVVGGGNSAAQILAEVSLVSTAFWAVHEPPQFLPDDVDGRVLFQRATERWNALQSGQAVEKPAGGLASIVMVPSVREARSRGVFDHPKFIDHFTQDGVVWTDNSGTVVDVVIWCTGFTPALSHLEALGVVQANGRVAMVGTRARNEERLWLVDYGEWTGFASATLIGVMRSARDTAREIGEFLKF